jgi:hypothetical protein
MMPEARTPGPSLGCARCPIFRVSQSGVQTEKQWIQGLRSSNQRISIIESAGEPPTGAPFGRARRLSRATEWLSMHGAGVRALVVTSIACVFRGRSRTPESSIVPRAFPLKTTVSHQRDKKLSRQSAVPIESLAFGRCDPLCFSDFPTETLRLPDP